MRLRILFAFLVSFTYSVQAQQALLALAKQMPKCSLACITSELPKSTCATNLTPECMCTNVALNAAVGLCAMKTCTVFELLQTKNVSSTNCGVPVRVSSQKFLWLAYGGIIVAVAAFLLRLAASLPKDGRQMAWDDATMAVVVVLAIPPAVLAHFLVENGLGRDMWTLKAQQISNVLHFYYIGEIFYVLALGFSKISILFFYLRVFPSKDFRIVIHCVMGLSVAYTIAFFFATTFQCMPLSMAWNQWDGLHKGKCNDIHIQGWTAAAINIALDAIVMILPLRHLARLNMNIRRKLMVMSMFSVGIIVIVISCLRLYSLVHFANSTNISWDYVEAGYWSLVEIDVSIVCGCMPAHRLLISRAWPRIKLTFHSGKGDSANSSNPSGGIRSNASVINKAPHISVKPQAGDEGDFVPLVDIESRNPRSFVTTESRSEHKNYTMQTNTVEGDREIDLATDPRDSDQLDSWPMSRKMTSKEHV